MTVVVNELSDLMVTGDVGGRRDGSDSLLLDTVNLELTKVHYHHVTLAANINHGYTLEQSHHSFM